MILKGDRREEVLTRARHRSVTAIVHMSIPNVGFDFHPESGVIIEDKRPIKALDLAADFVQAAHVWQYDDVCKPLAEREPKILHEVLDDLNRRTRNLDAGGLNHLRFNEQKAAFDSSDLIDRATGIPSLLRVRFSASAKGADGSIFSLPFVKLQDYLLRLTEKLGQVGGKIHSADVTHTASMNAFDYYEMGMTKYVAGRKLCYGDVMLARGHNLLLRAGVPLVSAPTPGAKLH